MRTIAIVNQKGGCGKTTVAINLSSTLAQSGKKVLLLDMDPQSHCAVGLAVPEEQIEQSVYDVLISKCRNEPIRLSEVLWQINNNLQLAPASFDLAAFEQQMIEFSERENCLKDVLSEVDGNFDYTIIDCPPAVGLLTFNALRSASDVIVPVDTGYFSLHGLSKQLETLSILSQRCSQPFNVKVLASMYDIRTKMGREILAELRKKFRDKMFRTVVNFNTKIKEASSLGQPINEYEPASKGRRDFSNLADELLGSATRPTSQDYVNTLSERLDSISATADELIQASKPEIKSVDTAAKNTQTPPTTESKLADYYGVSQMNDAVFFVTLYPRADQVFIAGDFNGWQPEHTPMQKVGNSGVWQTKIQLPQGTYRYRLVVDGQWQQDPYNEHTEPNPFGDLNSVLEVS